MFQNFCTGWISSIFFPLVSTKQLHKVLTIADCWVWLAYRSALAGGAELLSKHWRSWASIVGAVAGQHCFAFISWVSGYPLDNIHPSRGTLLSQRHTHCPMSHCQCLTPPMQETSHSRCGWRIKAGHLSHSGQLSIFLRSQDLYILVFCAQEDMISWCEASNMGSVC